MLAVDILEMLISYAAYCMVTMVYFAKRVGAVPPHDQTAVSISDAIIRSCSGA